MMVTTFSPWLEMALHEIMSKNFMHAKVCQELTSVSGIARDCNVSLCHMAVLPVDFVYHSSGTGAGDNLSAWCWLHQRLSLCGCIHASHTQVLASTACKPSVCASLAGPSLPDSLQPFAVVAKRCACACTLQLTTPACVLPKPMGRIISRRRFLVTQPPGLVLFFAKAPQIT